MAKKNKHPITKEITVTDGVGNTIIINSAGNFDGKDKTTISASASLHSAWSKGEYVPNKNTIHSEYNNSFDELF